MCPAGPHSLYWKSWKLCSANPPTQIRLPGEMVSALHLHQPVTETLLQRVVKALAWNSAAAVRGSTRLLQRRTGWSHGKALLATCTLLVLEFPVLITPIGWAFWYLERLMLLFGIHRWTLYLRMTRGHVWGSLNFVGSPFPKKDDPSTLGNFSSSMSHLRGAGPMFRMAQTQLCQSWHGTDQQDDTSKHL